MYMQFKGPLKAAPFMDSIYKIISIQSHIDRSPDTKYVLSADETKKKNTTELLHVVALYTFCIPSARRMHRDKPLKKELKNNFALKKKTYRIHHHSKCLVSNIKDKRQRSFFRIKRSVFSLFDSL